MRVSGLFPKICRVFFRYEDRYPKKNPYPQFTAVPNPNADFVPCKRLTPIRGITITPYGYLGAGVEAQFLVRDVHLQQSDRMVKVSVQFTSFNGPIVPRLYFDVGQGFDEKNSVSLIIEQSGRIDDTVVLPEGVQKIRFAPVNKETIFAIHEFELQFCGSMELKSLKFAKRERSLDILCFPVIDWDYRFQRPQQILSLLAQSGHRVFYLSTQFSGLFENKVVSREILHNVSEIRIPGNPRLSIYKDSVSENTLKKGVDALDKFLCDNEADQVVLLIHLPFWIPYAKELQRRFGWKIVYDCMDDHGGFENNAQEMLACEKDTIESSDLLVVTSDLLFKKCREEHPNCVLIPNAGDYKHFSQSISKEKSLIPEFSGPVIGYYGALAEWFDVEAIELAATCHPEWSFVLIGHVHWDKIAALAEKYKNIHLLGEKPYDSLPYFLAGFDVCTIPFQRNPLTEATNPVKVFEYLASGKPVVARRLPELECYAGRVMLYEQPKEFISLIEHALEDVESVSREARKLIALENTWDIRVAKLKSSIHHIFPGVSIVVVSYQSLEYLRITLESILANTQYPNYEIIVVDNASHQEVVEYLEQFAVSCPRLRLILNNENRGFAAANNQGIKSASESEFVVLLNNDVLTPSGWLSRLIYHAAKPDIGIVGPVTNSIGNEAQIDVPYDLMSLAEIPGFSRGLSQAYHSELFDIKVLAMFCVAFRREIYENVGLLDEDFGMGMFEDDDYAQRVRQAGYRVVCAEGVFVHHFGSVSFSKLASETYRKLFDKNRAIYEKKWGKWIPHSYRVKTDMRRIID